MSWNKFFLGIGIGVIGTTLLSELFLDKLLSSDKALQYVKEAYSKKGRITGSWIYAIPQDYKHSTLDYSIYKGGISCMENDQFVQYDFIVDAKTGCVLEMFPLGN